MNLLAVDTATEACSAALLSGDTRLERFAIAPRMHGELILAMIDELLAEAGLAPRDLDGIAFGQGPGAFTGVRIGVAVAQALALGQALPVVPVSDLQAIAQGCWREHQRERILVAVDARMHEIYAGAFAIEGGLMRPVAAECVLAADQWRPPAGVWTGAGTGWHSYAAELSALPGITTDQVDADRLPRAADILDLAVPVLAAGGGLDPADAMPVYLRNQVAHARSTP